MQQPTVLYEDDELLAILKPAGMVVNRSQTITVPTLQDWLDDYLGNFKYFNVKNEQAQLFVQRSGIAHRLDKETSGVLLCAKNPNSLSNLLGQFKQRLIKKTYLALVHSKLQTAQGEIHLPIARNSRMRLQFAVREGGRDSITEYEVVQYSPHFNVKLLQTELDQEQRSQDRKKFLKTGLSLNLRRATNLYQGFTYLKIKPLTGRTHQIRVHFSHLHHPLVGDKVYAGKKRQTLDALWCPRHFLHASSITFLHPITKKEITVTADLPADLQKAMKFIEE